MKYYIKTFGCQMNERDSEKIEYMLLLKGYKPGDIREADIVIVNSCAVREKSEKKIFSEIGRIKSLNKKAKFISMGCAAQIYPEKLSKISDVVIGTNAIFDFEKNFENDIHGVFLKNIMEDPNYIFGHTKGVRKYVDITYGCNNFCTYCVVPYTRLREISRSPQSIIDEIRYLVEIGAKEVILLGQNVNSYKHSDYDFVGLLNMINKIEGLERIRFVTSHPKDFDENVAKAISELDKVCNHVHLPLQSGSDRILKLMRRRYTFSEFAKKIEYFRKYNSDGAVTSDIIVGFPGETAEDFQSTINALKEIRFDEIYSFKYSNRPYTKASLMPNQIEEFQKKERLLILQNLQAEITQIINKKYINSIQEILVESKSKLGRQMQGRTKSNKVVNINSSNSLLKEGNIVNTRITKINRHSFLGELCTN